MPPTPCQLCLSARALVKRPKTGQQVCKSCFFEVFETEVHNTIMQGDNGQGVFRRGEKVAIGASGGKGKSIPPSYIISHHLTAPKARAKAEGSCDVFG